MGKVFERLILLKLQHQLTKLNFMRSEQHDLRTKLETIKHLMKQAEAAEVDISTNNTSLVIFFDIE